MKFRELAQLVETNSCLNIHHVVLKSWADDFVIPRPFGAIPLPSVTTHTMQAPDPRIFNQLRRTGKHSTFASSQIFGGVEGEAGEERHLRGACHRPDHAAFVFGGKSMSGIFDYRYVKFRCKRQKAIHTARMTIKRDRQDG